MRDLLAHCFTSKALQAQEPTIHFDIKKLIEELTDQCLQSAQQVAIVNIVEWFSYVVFDITGDLGFAESFHSLESSAMHPWISELFSYGKFGALVAALRHYTIMFNLFMRSIPKRSLDASRANFEWGVQKTHRRINLEVQGEDWMKCILRNSSKEAFQYLTDRELESNMNVMIFAGSDTCATVLSGATNYLIKTPHALESLIKEVRTSFQAPSEMSFAALQKLPYLDAVVNESLRMCPPNPSGLQHLVSEDGDTVLGHWLPGGTHVAVHQQSLYRSPSNFCEPNRFLPERWLPSAKLDSRFKNDNLEAVQNFSTGTWACIGQNLGLAELRSVITNLVWNFDISPAPGGRDVD